VAALVCGFPLMVIVLEWFRGTRARHRTRGANYLSAFLSLVWGNRPRYGGFIVHIGIILITLGVIGSTIYDIEETATLGVGESMTIGGYELTYQSRDVEEVGARLSATAHLSVARGDEPAGTVSPQLDYWFTRMDTFAEVAVRTTAAEDLFVSMVWTGFDSAAETATFRAKVNPLVVWMWVGGGFLLLGGAIAFWPQRKRRLAEEIQGDE
jgi:cytochrome c-type biogenesis protein CcmF